MRKLEPRGRNDHHIFDYSKITDLIYIGSDFCKGKDCPEHSAEFEFLGVHVELNLSAERKEVPPDDLESYSWIPVVDGYAPSPKQLDIGSSIINAAVKNGATVYVHCKNGHGRSPIMVAAYFVRFKGMRMDEAIDFIAKKRPEIHIEETQRAALEEFQKRHEDSLIR
jgi:protein-tyrosine phosphatase